jgi:hypothetical protein
MRSAKDVEQALKRADMDVEINAETDRAIMGELTNLHRKSAPCGPSGGRLGHVALAAAAVIVIVGVLLWSRREAPRSEDTPRLAATMSAAEMLTVRQLKAAYQRGGLGELEAQCEEAAEKVDGKPKEMSIKSLIAELEGT